MVIDLCYLIYYFQLQSIGVILLSGCAGILSADFSSGLLHWAADTWVIIVKCNLLKNHQKHFLFLFKQGSVDLPVIGKVCVKVLSFQ